MKRNRLLKATIGAVVGFILFASLAASVQRLYYFVMPGSWFINYYSAHVDNVLVGQDVQLDLCRTKRYDGLKLDLTRTFLTIRDGKGVPVSQYKLAPEPGDQECVTVNIPKKYQPQTPGTYRIHTEGSFSIQGNRKTLSYDTNEYTVGDTAESLQRRIDELQRQINELRVLLSQSRGAPSVSVVRSSAAVMADSNARSSAAPAPTPSSSQPSPSPAPTTPAGPAQSSPLSLLQPVTNPVVTLLNGVAPGVIR